MEPRLSKSKKWTPIPDELQMQMEGIFDENFGSKLQGYEVICEGRIYKSELLFRLGLTKEGELRQHNFEVSIEYDLKKENVMKLIHLSMDCAASMLEEFLSVGDAMDFPKIWEKHTLGKKDVYIQHSAENSKLEAEADRILGEDSNDLVQGADDEENLDVAITMLGLNDGQEDPTENSKKKTSKKATKKKTKKKLH